MSGPAAGQGRVTITPRRPLGNWSGRAACRGLDPAWWYPVPGRGSPYRKARSVCATCPVRRSCLDHALAAGEMLGLWGGLDPDERARLNRNGNRP